MDVDDGLSAQKAAGVRPDPQAADVPRAEEANVVLYDDAVRDLLVLIFVLLVAADVQG